MTSTMKKWDTKTTLRFVKLYAKHGCMWDKNISEYKNPLAREAAIQDIINKMGISEMTADDVKCKIRNIRNAYINEKKKIRIRKCTAVNGKQVDYVCKLSWFHVADQFLSKVVRRRIDDGSSSKLVYPDEEDEIYQTFVATNDEYGEQQFSDNSSARSQDEGVEPDEVYCEDFNVKLEAADESENDLEIVQNDFAFEFPRSNEHNRVSNDHYILQDDHMDDDETGNTYSRQLVRNPVTCYLDEDELCDQKPAVEELSEFDMFAKNIALQLKQLPLERALEVQKKIHDLLLNERLKIIRQQKSK